MSSYTPDQIFAVVQDCFVEALGVDDDEVTLKAKVIDDLGAESLDFLDIAFRLERSFDIKIPRGDVERQARESLGGESYEENGVLTEKALEHLKVAMPEVDPEAFQYGLKTKDIARLFIVETFYNICVKMLQEKGAAIAA